MAKASTSVRLQRADEHLSLACLELALRERLKEEMRTGKIKSKRPTLYPLLKYAVDHRLVKNEGFSAWQNRGEIKCGAVVIGGRRLLRIQRSRDAWQLEC